MPRRRPSPPRRRGAQSPSRNSGTHDQDSNGREPVGSDPGPSAHPGVVPSVAPAPGAPVQRPATGSWGDRETTGDTAGSFRSRRSPPGTGKRSAGRATHGTPRLPRPSGRAAEAREPPPLNEVQSSRAGSKTGGPAGGSSGGVFPAAVVIQRPAESSMIRWIRPMPEAPGRRIRSRKPEDLIVQKQVAMPPEREAKRSTSPQGEHRQNLPARTPTNQRQIAPIPRSHPFDISLDPIFLHPWRHAPGRQRIPPSFPPLLPRPQPSGGRGSLGRFHRVPPCPRCGFGGVGTRRLPLPRGPRLG